MNKELIKFIDSDSEFQEIIKELITDSTVLKMKNFKQHYNTSCYDHCYVVSYYCYVISKKYKLDYISAARAGMLHDLFLYDWRKKVPDQKGLHAFTHGKLACENASKLFDLNIKEQNMIKEHMWPITFKLPSSIESYILTFVDKYCALSESFDVLKTFLFKKKFFRFAYGYFSLFTLNFC